MFSVVMCLVSAAFSILLRSKQRRSSTNLLSYKLYSYTLTSKTGSELILGTYCKCTSVRAPYPCPRHFSPASFSAWISTQKPLFPSKPEWERRALPRQSWAPSALPEACARIQKASKRRGTHIPLVTETNLQSDGFFKISL